MVNVLLKFLEFKSKHGAVYFCAIAGWCDGGVLCGRRLFREDT